MNAQSLRPFRSWTALPVLLALAACAGDATPSASSSAAGGATGASADGKVAKANGNWAPIGYEETPKTGYTVIGGKEAPAPAIPMGERATVARILREGKDHNKVMEHITYLCNEIGPRLTGSTNQEKAAVWAKGKFESWGLSNVQLWRWGEIPVRFDRGPSTGNVLGPETRRRGDDQDAPVKLHSVRELEFTTLAWTMGTDGPVRGPVVWMPRNEDEYKEVKDKLKGAWLLVQRPRPGSRPGVGGRVGGPSLRYQQFKEARKKVAEGADPESLPVEQRVIFDGINGIVSCSTDDRVRTGGVRDFRDLDAAHINPDVEVIVRSIDYDYVNSRLSDNEDVMLEFDLKNTFTPGPFPVYDVIAEIPGTEKPDEVVIISAHMDSWNGPGSQGCTDNGTGMTVTMEAARILASCKVKPKRTIRFILWSGEEQGLLGSAAYVKMLKEKGELDKICACFVDDGGTNWEGGLKCLISQGPMLEAATAPVNGVFYSEVDKKFMDVNIQPAESVNGRPPGGGGSDHQSFFNAGVPGFFWDEVGRADYQFGWHTQNDKLNLAIPEYLVQSSTCAAVTAYNLACAPTLLPREPAKKKDDPEKSDKPASTSATATEKSEPAAASGTAR